MSDRDAQDWRHDPSVEDAVLSMPFTLIEPVAEEAAVAVEVETPWGIEAVGATSSPQTGKGVTVAVLDSGIDLKHPAFSGLTFDQNDLKDFTTKKDGKGVPGAAPDVFGHGTHVAGTIFGGEVDGKRIGVAPGITRALIGKVLKPEGTATHALFHALSWALEERADVICMSLSINFLGMVERLIEKGYPPDVAASRALEGYRSNVRMFDKFADFVKSRTDDERGALLVAASGNGSRRDINTQFTVAVAPPAAADGFISVGAVARTGDDAAPFKVADFSNTGCSVSAPGVGILSAKLGGGLKSLNGTSTATPHVAGVLALWTEKLFPNGGRPRGWTEDVRLAVLGSLTRTPGQSRGDVGRGIVRAPQP